MVEHDKKWRLLFAGKKSRLEWPCTTWTNRLITVTTIWRTRMASWHRMTSSGSTSNASVQSLTKITSTRREYQEKFLNTLARWDHVQTRKTGISSAMVHREINQIIKLSWSHNPSTWRSLIPRTPGERHNLHAPLQWLLLVLGHLRRSQHWPRHLGQKLFKQLIPLTAINITT